MVDITFIADRKVFEFYGARSTGALKWSHGYACSLDLANAAPSAPTAFSAHNFMQDMTKAVFWNAYCLSYLEHIQLAVC